MAILALGTAQLGLNYGINNTSGKPDWTGAQSILDLAVERGIVNFDTAPVYGDAEEILGKYIESRDLNGKVDVTSKLPSNFSDDGVSDPRNQVEKAIRQSLSRLRIESIGGYLMHDPKHMYWDEVVETLQSVKKMGLIKRVGVSVYNIEDASFAAKSEFIDQIQIPYSILDQRLHSTNFFQLVREKRKTVHARSAFLQGLIFMDPDKIPQHLRAARPLVKRLRELSIEFDVPLGAMALLFSKSNVSISHVIFGAENEAQLKENIDIFSGPALNENLLELIRREFKVVDSYVVNPSQWR